ncbi:hypothetical protein [Pleomorphomonas sp. NRK KF1]|uniref:hypothetical protein n=1 Tax=Pleomorphomonas sp. NRK KF1 TaxID=2943000 RepID=UPI00204361AC|nr:hypothetical protein [Pleomorphomonas sp. NRK KF1]MCM5553896.1 hypothetical protein [Pleomorphomonas sp. NRK KF1]
MQLPVLGTIPTVTSLPATGSAASQADDTSTRFGAKTAPSTAKTNDNVVSSPASLLADEMQASVVEIQEKANSEADKKETVVINGLSVITSGHSIDQRQGVSLLRTVSSSDMDQLRNTLTSFVPRETDADNDQAQAKAGDGIEVIEIQINGGMKETSAKANTALGFGATSAYTTDDWFRIEGDWSTGDPMKKSNSDDAIEADQRLRLERLMNSVSAEKELQSKYGDDVKLVYSQVDNSYIMLTPDDAKYNEMQSVESGIQDVIRDVRMGYMDGDVANDVMNKYGYSV